ncbi:MAG: 50S ribosomal protein L18 [Candidatus Nealsonbacteria bacterium]|nr:MAG: 50S ribosomal protein L18 [Candidatus Nealsonbacteria bacterium]
MNVKGKRRKKYRRHKRVRGKISGTAKRPRLCVFRSNKHIYAQLIDDERNRIIASANDLELNVVKKSKKSIKKATAGKEEFSGKLAPAFEVGKLIAQKAKELKIKEIVFDRGGYKYHGRVKSLAEGARAGELKF